MQCILNAHCTTYWKMWASISRFRNCSHFGHEDASRVCFHLSRVSRYLWETRAVQYIAKTMPLISHCESERIVTRLHMIYFHLSHSEITESSESFLCLQFTFYNRTDAHPCVHKSSYILNTSKKCATPEDISLEKWKEIFDVSRRACEFLEMLLEISNVNFMIVCKYDIVI